MTNMNFNMRRKTRRTTLEFFNPSDKLKAEQSAARFRKRGINVVVERNKRFGTIDVLKINKPKPKKRGLLF